jgi:hypothetical protein
MMKKQYGSTFTELFLVLLIPLAIAIKVGILWLGASALVGGIKKVSGDCGQEYAVSFMLADDMFCPVKKE